MFCSEIFKTFQYKDDNEILNNSYIQIYFYNNFEMNRYG